MSKGDLVVFANSKDCSPGLVLRTFITGGARFVTTAEVMWGSGQILYAYVHHLKVVSKSKS